MKDSKVLKHEISKNQLIIWSVGRSVGLFNSTIYTTKFLIERFGSPKSNKTQKTST